MNIKKIFLSALVAAGALCAQSQTLFVPSGTSGIGTSGTGNVGIGTTSPQSSLDVNGNIQISNASIPMGLMTEVGGTTPLLNMSVNFREPNKNTSYLGAGFRIDTRAGTFPLFNWISRLAGGSETTLMSLTQSGSLGIGTSSPQSLLHINSTVDSRSTFHLYWNSDLSKYFSFWQGITGAVIDPIGTGRIQLGYDQSTDVIMGLSGSGVVQGRVGVGTLSPSAKVHINGSGGANTDLMVTGRITTGDAANAGGMYVNSAATMLVGQLNSSTMGMYNNGAWRMVVDNSGRVGIGTTQPDYPLTVNGSIHAKEVRVDLNVPAPDYVFEKDYQLTSLEDIKNYIDQNKHLPEVPSAKEMEKNGVQLGEMNMILLRKIEELTLHIIQQEEHAKQQDERIKNLEAEIKRK